MHEKQSADERAKLSRTGLDRLSGQPPRLRGRGLKSQRFRGGGQKKIAARKRECIKNAPVLVSSKHQFPLAKDSQALIELLKAGFIVIKKVYPCARAPS